MPGKWTDTFVLILGVSDDAVTNAASKYAHYYGASTAAYPSALGDFHELGEDGLADLNSQSRLMIFGHGGVGHAGTILMEAPDGDSYAPEWIAGFLREYGALTKVGLISFKVCQLGLGDFLPRFCCELRKVQFGFAKAYKGKTL